MYFPNSCYRNYSLYKYCVENSIDGRNARHFYLHSRDWMNHEVGKLFCKTHEWNWKQEGREKKKKQI